MKVRTLVSVLVVLAIAACSDSEGPEAAPPTEVTIGSLRFSAETRLTNDETVVETVLSISNIGSTVQMVEVGGCPLRMLGYANASRDGEPVWNELDTRPPCPAVTRPATLQPGEVDIEYQGAAVGQIKAATSHRGVFYFVTIVEPTGMEDVILSSGQVTID